MPSARPQQECTRLLLKGRVLTCTVSKHHGVALLAPAVWWVLGGGGGLRELLGGGGELVVARALVARELHAGGQSAPISAPGSRGNRTHAPATHAAARVASKGGIADVFIFYPKMNSLSDDRGRAVRARVPFVACPQLAGTCRAAGAAGSPQCPRRPWRRSRSCSPSLSSREAAAKSAAKTAAKSLR